MNRYNKLVLSILLIIIILILISNCMVIASSKSKENIVLKVNARTITATWSDNLDYIINIVWDPYEGADGYRIYRSVNGASYEQINDIEVKPDYYCYDRYDNNVEIGNIYSYYVTAYGDNWETDPSKIVTRKTFLPPCFLISPQYNIMISDSTPTFIWSPVGVSFPYGVIPSGNTNLRVCDDTLKKIVWSIWFDGMTTSKAIYNQDGKASSLIPGHTYSWWVWGFGRDNEGNWIATSESERWVFTYKKSERNVVSNVEATAITRHIPTGDKYPNSEGDIIKITEIGWRAFPGTTKYRVYRSINKEIYKLKGEYDFGDLPSGGKWIGCGDLYTLEGNSYSYHVTAYKDDWETSPSQKTLTIDTWLPPCSLIYPEDDIIINNPTPTFIWSPPGVSFPYGSISHGDSHFYVWDMTIDKSAWLISFDNVDTSTITYNQDGKASPLVNGHRYKWYSTNNGYDENDNTIARSSSETWEFVYNEK